MIFCLVHAAVLAINEAIDQGDAQVTLSKLQNPAATLTNIQEHSDRYQSNLETAKKQKKSASENGDVSEADAYDYMLTKSEIQDCILEVNTQVEKEIEEAKCKFNSCTVRDWFLCQSYSHTNILVLFS